MAESKLEWNVLLTANGLPCDECGKIEYLYQDHICWATTKGLEEHFQHPEFELVINLGPQAIMGILNNLGRLVKQGKRFNAGDFVHQVIMDFPVRLVKSPENGRLLRVLLPDANGKWPEDSDCEYPFSAQLLPLSELKRGGAHELPS